MGTTETVSYDDATAVELAAEFRQRESMPWPWWVGESFGDADVHLICGNNGYTQDERARVAVDLLRQRLDDANIPVLGFGVDNIADEARGWAWAMIVRAASPDDLYDFGYEAVRVAYEPNLYDLCSDVAREEWNHYATDVASTYNISIPGCDYAAERWRWVPGIAVVLRQHAPLRDSLWSQEITHLLQYLDFAEIDDLGLGVDVSREDDAHCTWAMLVRTSDIDSLNEALASVLNAGPR